MSDFFEINQQNLNFSDLQLAAEVYLSLGYSLIPVYGDTQPDRAKVAAVAWSIFRQRRPTVNEIRHWFHDMRFGGLAIITGHISGLVVLDFDDPSRAEAFARYCPHLTETRTVRSASRGLPHYYYRLPPHLHLDSRRASGVDLQADGRYVLAPPTVIGGKAYEISRGGSPRDLSNADIALILRFMSEKALPGHPNTISPANRLSLPTPVHKSAKRLTDAVTPVTQADLVALYQHLAAEYGRNEALFKTSLRARDSGWNLMATIEALRELHIVCPAISSHSTETRSQRHREAARTVDSAFSRPPGRYHKSLVNTGQLPNRARETLFEMGLTCVVRVIESLYHLGIKPGDTFTEPQARQILAGKVGRHSLLKALSAITSSDTALFDRTSSRSSPSGHPQTPKGVAQKTTNIPTNQCSFVNTTKPNKSRTGRPPRRYLMPGPLEICAKLGLKPAKSDSLDPDDLTSAKKCRQAVHRELIKRRPGRYSRAWLAHRLGISVRTCQRYNIEIPIHVVPLYIEKPISWSSINQIPAGFSVAGTFLEDENRQRYPPIPGIAVKLLARGHRVTYKRRDVNYYWYGEQPPWIGLAFGEHPEQHFIRNDQQEIWCYVRRWRREQDTQQPAAAHNAQTRRQPAPAIISNSENGESAVEQRQSGELPPHQHPRASSLHEPRHRSTRRRYRRPLPDSRAEKLALEAYETVNRLATGEASSISQVSARRLVDTYGIQPVRKALRLLQVRGNIRNPAGFIVTVARSEARVALSIVSYG